MIFESRVDISKIWYFGNNRAKDLKLVPPKWYAPFFLTTDYSYAEDYSDYGVYTITLKGEAKSKILDFSKDSDVKKLKWPKALIDDIRTGKSDLNGIAYDMYILAGYGQSQEVFDRSWHLSDAAYDFDERSYNIFDIVPKHANWASEKDHRFVLLMWKDIHDAGFDGFTHLEFGKRILALFDFKCMDKISIKPVKAVVDEKLKSRALRKASKTILKVDVSMIEESYQLDLKLWFHGTPKKRPLLKPSPLKPFYVTEDPAYAVLFSNSAENKSQSTSNGFVYAVTLDASLLNIFDLNSKADILKLKLPKILEYYFTNIKLDAYNILCELLMSLIKLVDIGNKWLSMSNKADADKIVDAEFKKREEKPETDEEWGEPEQPIIEFFDGNNHGFKNADAKEFLMWALHKLNDAGIESIPYRTAFGSQDSNFTTKAYAIVAALVLDDILSLGYNATSSFEEGLDGLMHKCIGIIDYDAIDMLSKKTLTIDLANQLASFMKINSVKASDSSTIDKLVHAVLDGKDISGESIKEFLEKTYSSKQNLLEDCEDNNSSIKQMFDEVVSKYKDLFEIDLSYMTFKVDSLPVYTNGQPCYEYDEDECAGDCTSLGWIRLNPDMKSVMDRYGVDGDVSLFTKTIIAHELAHEVWNNIADDLFKEEILDEARQQEFNTVYLDTVRPSKLAEETFCEYLAHKITLHGFSSTDNLKT